MTKQVVHIPASEKATVKQTCRSLAAAAGHQLGPKPRRETFLVQGLQQWQSVPSACWTFTCETCGRDTTITIKTDRLSLEQDGWVIVPIETPCTGR